MTDKVYRWHTGYPGGLKQITVERLLEKKPEEVMIVYYTIICNNLFVL
jgi:large subunit ribosomal protein L13